MSGGGDVVIRAPNHLGDLVMALPALEAAHADVLVLRALAPLVRMAAEGRPVARRVLSFDRGRRGFLEAVRTLRQGAIGGEFFFPPRSDRPCFSPRAG